MVWPLLRAPAVKALLLQCLAFFITGLTLVGIAYVTGSRIGIVAAALLQGSVAAALSFRFRLAFWWLPIQLLFPVTLLVVSALHLPPALFLVLFLFFLLLYWSSFRTQVPYFPSHPAVRQAVAALLPAGSPHFIDIGSGFGGMVLHLAALRREGVFVGIEIAPLPWLASWLRARWQASAARFLRGDYTHLNFADYDVVYAYLSPAAMPALWGKAHSEMRDGCLLVSYEFPIPGHEPDSVSYPVSGGPALHVWRMR